MTKSVPAALQQLRDADPGAHLPVTDTTRLEAVLAQVRADRVDLDLIPAPEVGVGTGRRRTGLSIALACVAVIVIAGAVLAIVGRHNSRAPHVADADRPTPSHVAATPTPGSTDDPNYPPALAQVNQTLATLPALPGSTQLLSAPLKVLQQPSSREEDGNLIDKPVFWSAPGTPAAAIAYLQSHRPDHTRLDSTSGSAGREQNISFSGRPGPYRTIYVSYDIVSYQSGVAVRGDVQKLWYTTKPAQERIGTVSSVDIILDRHTSGGNKMPGVPSVRRTLVGAQAQKLAAAVDAAQVGNAGSHPCPPGLGYTDTLTFHAGSRTIRVVGYDGGCAGMTVTVDGTRQPRLLGSIDAPTLKALGLPANYGRP